MAKVEDNRIPEVQEEVEVALEKAFTEIGLVCSGYATSLCATDTGLLRNSVTYAVDGHPVAKKSYKANKPKKGKKKQTGKYSGGKVGTRENKGVYVGTNVEYAPYEEFGTSKRKKPLQPFIRPAFQNHIKEYENILRTELGEVE